MAKTSGGALIALGLVVLLLGIIFFPLVIETEDEAGDSCDLANEGDAAGNETCDNKDRKFLGMTSWLYIIGVVTVFLLLVIFGAIKLKDS